MSAGPVTIADPTRDQKLLTIDCLECGRHVYINAESEAAAKRACSGCGAIKQPTWHPIWRLPTHECQGCCSHLYAYAR